MTIQVLEPRRIVKHVARVMVDDLEVTYDVLEVLEELYECDGDFRRLLINDSNLAKVLEQRGLTTRSNRGSYYRGSKLGAWLDAAHQAGIGQALADSAAMARWRP